MELEKDYLESQHKEARIDAELFRQMSDKENELYEVKIKLIQKENEIIMLNQRVGAIERQAGSLRTERDKLIQISGDLKAQILTFERQKEVEAQKGKMREYKEQANKVQAQESAAENVKESRLDQLRLEVEQMRDIVNKFKIDGGEQPIQAKIKGEKEMYEREVQVVRESYNRGQETFGARNSENSMMSPPMMTLGRVQFDKP